MSQFLKISSVGSATSICLTRADLHNAFNDDMMRDVTDAFAAAGKDEKVRAVILAGEGKSFCAGADIHWMKRMVDYSVDENIADADVLATMLRTIRECPRPTIACVHGAAYGGGVGLIAACDMAVATTGVTFCLSEVKLGIVPAVISPFVLEKIGPGAARRYALTAERFDATEAKRIGMVNEVVAGDAELDAWIDNIVKHLLACGPTAIAECKKILSAAAGQQWDSVQNLTTRTIARVRVSAEGQEGLRAFLEKRKPKWAAE